MLGAWFLAACGFPQYGGFVDEPGGGGSGGAPGGSGGAPPGGNGGGGNGGMGGAPGCTTDDDCLGSPFGPACDTTTSLCVECVPPGDACILGLYCTAQKKCAPGCDDDGDCNVGPGGSGGGGSGGSGGAGGSAGGGSGGSGGAQPPLTCDVPTHTCVGCLDDDACPPGTICEIATAKCIAGCTPKHACWRGATCCEGTCSDLLIDEAHCGACDTPCTPANGDGVCNAGTCELTGCDPGFDDCDGEAASGCESQSAIDPENCGGCGMPCVGFPNAAPACSGGACSLGACMGAFANCDGLAPNGCETNTLTSVANCGGCGDGCTLDHASATCQNGGCAVGACSGAYLDCDMGAANGCEIDGATDANNCGGCGNVCQVDNASAKCEQSSCGISMCAPPFADCNLSPVDGCETNLNTSMQSCGACGVACALANATATCSNGGCAVVSCNPGFGDCDGLAANGCEVNLNTSVGNCGNCNAACSNNNGTPSCSGGSCSISCDPGFANCDGSAQNGCEISTTSNVNNCSSCGNVCPPQGGTPACVNSSCTVSNCMPGKADCDGNGANGCEVTTTNDVANCGGCGLACFVANGTAGCAASNCLVASCNPGFDNCDGLAANGCETNLKTLSSCGGCGVPCSLPNAISSCATGTCQIASCNAGWADCDGLAANGCETHTDVDPTDCGACGNACGTANGTASCSGGICAISCNAGFSNCNGSTLDGCETATINNVAACGGCGIVCSAQNGVPACAGTTCIVGSCTAPFKDCDGQYANGCEVNSAVATNNCGNCGTVCTNPHGMTSCVGGACAPSCSAGYASCDGNLVNGCETDTQTSLSHCGACNAPCTFSNGVPSCMAGTCSMTGCLSGFGDCDLMSGNGCETALNQLSNCGSCGTVCSNPNGSTNCTGGACVPSCNGGFASCDANPNNGCETSLSTLSNCGGCGVSCGFPNAAESCPGGTCTMGACDFGFGNCNGMTGDGCEVNTQTSSQHCGGCNAPCGMGQVCVGGACVDSCPMGQADCDGLSGNGCEINTTNDGDHCGNCLTNCPVSQYCSSSSCVACGAGASDCDGAGANGCEVATATDPNNCGGCGTKCGSDGTCGCSASACSGGTIHFSEDFSDNSKGWTLGTQWQIGSATASAGQQQGNPDPASDHSSTADNGVAGVMIGGNYTNSPQHGPYYLTSPVIDLSGASGNVFLTYWRWLNCDWDPFTVHTVEVFNGSSWVVVWTNSTLGNVFVTDAAWTRLEHNVTAYKNANFQIRYGFSVGKQGQFLAWIMSGWNVDDVSLSSTTCN